MIQGIKVNRGSSNLSGTATAENVLSGKTFYNTDSNEELIGTMPSHGAISKVFTPAASVQTYVIPEGHHPGTGKVTVNPVVGGGQTKSYTSQGNRTSFNLDFNIPVMNKLHVCASSFWARGSFIVYGIKNGVYIKLHESAYPVDPSGSNINLGITCDLTGRYDGVRIAVVRDEIYNEWCFFVATVAAI